jgi:RNA polymerase sigma-70 factor (ECF subfamily)
MLNDILTRIGNTFSRSTENEPDEMIADLAEEDASPSDDRESALAPEPKDLLVDQETALLANARNGDEVAFQTLLDAHYGRVYGLACRTVRDPDEAAEIAQDVFWAAWRNLNTFRGDARFSTWLYRITYRRCLQSIEVRQNRIEAARQFATMQLERFANEWGEMQVNLAEQEWRQAVRDQIGMLPQKYQQVLFLRHFQDLSYEEIAQQLTIPISSVKTHLFRARALLRDRLQQVEMPHIELPHVELPHVELSDVGSAVRDGLDNLGSLLRGHINLGNV